MTDTSTTDRQRPLPSPSPLGGSVLTSVLVACVVVGALYFGREILVPIALAVLLSFVLAPLVRILQRARCPRSLAVAIVVAFAFAAILGLGAFMVSQVNQLASDLPTYQHTLREKIKKLRGATAGSGTLDRASEVLQDLGKELDKPNTETGLRPASGISAPAPDKPIPVEVRQPDPGALQTLTALITPLIHPLTTTGIVLVFVIFILIQREDLRNRFIRLVGAADLQRTTAAMGDAGKRLSRLFLTQLMVNAAFGVVIGLGLWLIGVPSAPLWGMLAGILRFVPYVGAFIGAILPLVLAAAVGPDWSMVLWTTALFLIVEPIVGHVIEPLLYGHSTGLSPVAVVVSATFWTWLWGPVGLVLATPLTVCLVVIGRHVDQLKFLDVMLGDRPPLTPPELAYQRMLAGDPVEAVEQAEVFLQDRPLVEYYEQVLIAGLNLAEADAKRGRLDTARMLRIRDSVAEIIDDLSAFEAPKVIPQQETSETPGPLALPALADAPAEDKKELPEHWRTGKPVLCVPGLGLLDEAAALIVTQLIEKQGIGARAERADALSISRIFGLDTKGVAVICLCYVECVTTAQVRYSIRRLRRKAPDAFMLVALLGDRNSGVETGRVGVQNVAFVRTLTEATEALHARAAAEGKVPELAAPAPEPALQSA
jgi:predicted PurR-regulated permease PerM